MTDPAQLPLLFLDVDGPLIPFGATSGHYPTYTTGPHTNPLLSRLNPDHGRQLAALSCQLVWATTWTTDADECITPLLGLPQLPVVTWPEPSDTDDQDERHGLHWKTRTLIQWAQGRPFAWADDEITDTDRAWVAHHHPGQALLHRVDPRHGLTPHDYATLNTWLTQHT
ncbi:HAD domain-containing protein [Kitasatospora sp. NPDC093806]|uniref:HAD domain-containing protein n=1 Tax=Kitasatospora sp. NPDC093806 TaxID=3155075 RepID=UPI00341A2929